MSQRGSLAPPAPHSFAGQVARSAGGCANALGAVLSSTIPVSVTGKLLSSGQFDPDAGLVYASDGRWYDPVLAVYLQPDPFGGAPVLRCALDASQKRLNRSIAMQRGPALFQHWAVCQAVVQVLWHFKKAWLPILSRQSRDKLTSGERDILIIETPGSLPPIILIANHNELTLHG